MKKINDKREYYNCNYDLFVKYYNKILRENNKQLKIPLECDI